MKKTLWLMLCFIALPASADRESEHQELHLLLNQLDKLDYLITRAEREADYRLNRQFDYDALRLDVRTIQSGIHVYLNPKRQEPTPIEPISGDYLLKAAHE